MKFTCNSCGAQYMISDEKVGPGGVKVRCKKCGNVVLVRRATEEDAAAAPAPAAGANGAAAPAAGGLDAELGQAFDNAFGDAPPAPEPAADLGATQAMAPEDQARVAAAAAAPAAPAATEWYVAIGQAQVGPLPLAEVKRKWEAGDVGPDSLVWRPGMGDWQPLSSVSELAGYLAPVARPAPSAPADAAPAPRASTAESPADSPAPAPAAAEVSWKPVGASALAALASEEIASRNAPVERKAASGAATPSGVKSLVEGLPDGGGVDPTGAIPLSIKGMEITGEKKLERRSSVATRAEEARHKRSMTRVIAIAAAVVVVVVGGAAAFVLGQRRSEPQAIAVAPPAPVTPPPAAAPPAPTPPPAAAAPAPVAPPPAAVAATPPPAPAAQPEPPPPARPAPEPPAHKAAPPPKGKHARVAKAEPPPRPAPAARGAAEAPPAPAPRAGKKKDSLLDFDSSDSALDEALGGGGGSGRAVYVPPAPGGGGGALPAKLSPAQINEAVAGRIDSLRRCVSEQKSRDPAASGVLKLKWVIAGDGGVRDVKSLPGDYASGPFSTCITGVVKGIKFPRSTTTGQEVTFPFSF